MKWPKILHLPDSPGVMNDDRVLDNVSCFAGREVVITEKLDGECTSLHSDKCHARSEDSLHHDSRTWVKNLHGKIRWMIPAHIQIVGENVYAEHSIPYDRLTTFFFDFAVIDKERSLILSADETLAWCEKLGLAHAPVLHRGQFPENFSLPPQSNFGNECEGYVVRLADEFPLSKFQRSIAKWVRKGHVKTGNFWMKNWKPNKLTADLTRLHPSAAKM